MNQRPSYLVLKATAAQLPLREESVSLVIATPPYLTAKRARKEEFGADTAVEYEELMDRFLEEAARVVTLGGHIAVHTDYPPSPEPKHQPQVVFQVWQKKTRSAAAEWVGSEPLRVRHIHVRDFSWLALPIWVYRVLIEKYSRPGDAIAHVFSGSGNGGLAALSLGRRPVLIDLYYQRQTLRRLEKKARALAPSEP